MCLTAFRSFLGVVRGALWLGWRSFLVPVKTKP
jgi:hypothetical protein